MGNKITTSELLDMIASNTGLLKKDVKSVLDALPEVVALELKHGNAVALSNLGTFKPVQRAARTGRNPSTGAPVDIPASVGAGFSAAKSLKEALKA